MPIEDDDAQLEALAQRAIELLAAKSLTLVTAESCTAGLLASVLSRTTGASRYFHGGLITYTKAMKSRVLGVDPELMHRRGAVCGEVAVAMARGALRATPADIAIAIMGVAGPEPDEDGNPVGLMCVAVGFSRRETVSWRKCYPNHGPRLILQNVMSEAMMRLTALLEKRSPAGESPRRFLHLVN
jgi:nicotinamide-nucleotide amidase